MLCCSLPNLPDELAHIGLGDLAERLLSEGRQDVFPQQALALSISALGENWRAFLRSFHEVV